MKNVIILGNLFTFPDFSAAAASNRVYAYSKGFLKNKVNPTVITLSNVYWPDTRNYENGIEYFVAICQKKRKKYFLIRRYYRIKRYFNVITFIHKKHKFKNPIDAIILYTRSPFVMIFAKLLALFFSIKLILEVTEHPFNDFKKYSCWKIIVPWVIYKFFDGFICISTSLEKYCEQYKNKKATIIKIPPLVDFDSFKCAYLNPKNEEYLFYSGSLTIKRDGIDNLIKAFYLVNQKHVSLKLILGGICYDEPTKSEIFRLIKSLELENRVLFLDFLPKEELLTYIFNAKILCVARRDNNQTSSAFPTKVAEYLYSGIPLIVTRVGDISNYLEDGVNAYLAESDNIEVFAEKIEYMIENYQLALNVAKKGKEIAISCFSNDENVKTIIEFIKRLN